MRGPCMCGDPYCWSCGPAQGNHRCQICGQWTLDGGCEKPAECAELDRQIAENEHRQWEQMEQQAKEYWGGET